MRFWPQLALIALTVLVFWRIQPQFLDAAYLLDKSTIFAETGLIALGMTYIITAGQIDLSVGSMMGLCAVLTAWLIARGWPVPGAVLCAVGAGALMGTINGLMVARLRLASFLVTLGTMALYRGVAEAALGPNSIKLVAGKGLDRQLFAQLPAPLLIVLVLSGALGLLLCRGTFGRWVTATGANESAALHSGIPVERVKTLVFVLTGALAGLAGAMIVSRLGVARADIGKGAELEAITLVVVGGTLITGGRGTMLGTVLAFLLIVLLRTGMGVANVKPEVQLTAIGILLVVAALATLVGPRRKRI